MKKDEQLLIDSIHELAAGKPLREQISLFRLHARTTAREAVAAHLYQCADELEAAAARCHQLRLGFHPQA